MLVLLIGGDFELLAFVVRDFTVLNSTRDGKEGLARELRMVLSQSNGWAWMNSFFFSFFELVVHCRNRIMKRIFSFRE